MPPSRAFGYLRVSTAGQAADDRWSLPAQRRAITEHAERMGWEIAGWYEDPGISGASIDARPGMLQLLKDVSAGMADYVVAIEFERFSRGRGRDWDRILEACELGGAKLATPLQTLDPSKADDGFMSELFAALSRRERRKLAERTRVAKRERALAGQWHGGTPPVGYRVAATGHLEPDLERVPLVREVFAAVIEGRSFNAIAAALTERAEPTVRGGRRWYASQISAMVRNPIYVGELPFGKDHRHRSKCVAKGRIQNAHPAIVEPRVFAEANALLKARGRAQLPKATASPYPLTGLAFCPCGGRLVGCGDRRRRYYGCLPSIQSSGKAHSRLRAEKLEQLVLDHVAAVLGTPQVLEDVRRELVLERMREGSSDFRQRADLEDALAESKRRALLLWEDRAEGRLTGEQFGELNAVEQSRQAATRDRLDAVEARILGMARVVDVEHLVERLGDMARVLQVLTPVELRTLLQEVLERVDVVDRALEGGDSLEVAFRLPGISGRTPATKTPSREGGDGGAQLRQAL